MKSNKEKYKNCYACYQSQDTKDELGQFAVDVKQCESAPVSICGFPIGEVDFLTCIWVLFNPIEYNRTGYRIVDFKQPVPDLVSARIIGRKYFDNTVKHPDTSCVGFDDKHGMPCRRFVESIVLSEVVLPVQVFTGTMFEIGPTAG